MLPGARGTVTGKRKGHDGDSVPAPSERPLHPKEKVLEQALQWCKLPEPSSAYLLVRKVPISEASCLFTGEGHSTHGWPQPAPIAGAPCD